METTDSSPAAPGPTIAFYVVRLEAGTPVAGAEVTVSDGETKQQWQTDERGGCRIALTAQPSSLLVQVRQAGLVPMRVLWDLEQPGRVLPGEFTLTLAAACVVGGTVHDEQGRGIAGAIVSLVLPHRPEAGRLSPVVESDIYGRKVETDAGGRWQFPEAPAEFDVCFLTVRHPDFLEHSMTEEGSGRLRAATHTTVLKQGVRVEGIVQDRAGRPIEGALILPGRDRVCSNEKPVYQTDAGGRFVLPHVERGSLSLTFKAEGYAPELRQIKETGGSAPLEVVLEPGRSLRGRVVDADGRPLAGVHVFADSWRGHRTLETCLLTDEEGRFHWSSAPPDEVNFHVLKRGYLAVRGLLLQASEEEQTIVLQPPQTVRGRVTDASTRLPLSRFQVLYGFRYPNGRRYWQRERVADFAEGEYTCRFTEPAGLRGRRLIRIEAAGYRSAERELDEFEGEQRVDFQLQPGPPTAGCVLLADGSPAAGAELAVVFGNSAQVVDGKLVHGLGNFALTADAEGRFTFPTQEPPYAVVAVHEDGCAMVMAEQLGAAIQLQRWGRLEIALATPPDEDAPPAFYLNFDHRPADANGYPWIDWQPKAEVRPGVGLVFSKLPPGRAWVARFGQSTERAIPVMIAAGETAHLDFGSAAAGQADGPPGSSPALVKVVDEHQQPIAAARIALVGLGKSFGHSSTFMPWRGEAAAPLETSGEGLAHIPFPPFLFGEERTEEIHLRVDHPDYCPADVTQPVDGSALPIVLQRGATLKLFAETSDGHEVTEALYPEIALGGGRQHVRPETWRKLEGGGWINRQIPPGAFALRAAWLPAMGAFQFSPVVCGEVQAGETREYLLPLQAGIRVEGELDPQVPRPIVDGRVVIVVTTPGTAEAPALQWRTTAEVGRGGGFLIDALPPGVAELVAVCAGFCSASPGGDPPHLRRAQEFALDASPVRIVPRMEPTADCELTVLDDARRPVAGASVQLCPNIVWREGGASLFPGEAGCQEDFLRLPFEAWMRKLEEAQRDTRYSAQTDAQGRAIVRDLPAGQVFFSVTHEDWPATMSLDADFAERQVDLVAGKLTRKCVRLPKAAAP